MDTQYYTTTTSPVLTFEEYYDIPSEHITGQRTPFSQRARTLMEVDLTVAYKIYDIKAIHHYEVHEEQGGDSYMDICETYFKVDRDTIEIIEVKDIDGGMHAGQLHWLKEYGEQNNL